MRTRTALLIGAGAAASVAVLRAVRSSDGAPVVRLDDGERLAVETSDGARLVVDVVGPADGPTVVLAHCWGGDVANWAPVAAPLVDSGHRVVRWYQRGHGPSTVGSDGFAIERFGADLAELLAALDVRDAVVAGHSLGGMTTQAMATGHPDVVSERVKGLVLVATSAGALGATALGRSGGPVLRIAAADTLLSSRYGHVLVRGALGRGASPAAVRLTRDHFVATSRETRTGVFESIVRMDLRTAGGSIAAPTTVIVGTRDTLTPPSHSRAMASVIPGANLVVLPGRGHMLPLEAPDDVVEAIRSHLAG